MLMPFMFMQHLDPRLGARRAIVIGMVCLTHANTPTCSHLFTYHVLRHYIISITLSSILVAQGVGGGYSACPLASFVVPGRTSG